MNGVLKIPKCIISQLFNKRQCKSVFSIFVQFEILEVGEEHLSNLVFHKKETEPLKDEQRNMPAFLKLEDAILLRVAMF